MATSIYSLHVYRNSVHTQKPGFCITTSKNQKLQGIVNFNIVKAKVSSDSDSDQNTKPKSVICGDCNGNGAVLCSQCKGNGVNSVDFFNGQFKAGDSCWLCGGKKDMLCGNCNGAGFIGGFMNSFDN